MKSNFQNLFLDRDGVINEVVMRNGKASSPRLFSEFTLRDDFLQFYARMQPANFRFFVVSNQPDVRRELLKMTELERMVAEIKRRFLFEEIVHCVHDDRDDCGCRKPKPGMLNYLVAKYELLPERCLLIGDSDKDIAAAKSAGVKSVLLARPYNSGSDASPDFLLNNLTDLFDRLNF